MQRCLYTVLTQATATLNKLLRRPGDDIEIELSKTFTIFVLEEFSVIKDVAVEADVVVAFHSED